MTYDEIPIAKSVPLARVAQLIEECALAEGLRTALRGTLAQYAGSIHWHFKKGKEAGTLEVTLLNRERRVELSVRANRAGPWTEATLERISAALGERLLSAAGETPR